MKRTLRYLLAIVISCWGTMAYCQTAASYGYSVLSAPFVDISATGTPIIHPVSGLHLGAAGIDITIQNIPIGFSFTFCGSSYFQLSASNKCCISLDNASYIAFTNIAANIAGPGFLMAFWDDLRGTGVDHYYQTTGIAPNRVFTIQYNQVIQYIVSPTAYGKLQIKLYETSGIIDYCYGSGTIAGTSATMGIANGTTDFQVVLAGLGGTTTTVLGLGAAAPPASGVVLRWSPPCPVALSATNSGPVCTGGTVTLTATTSGTSYSWTGPGGFTSTMLSPVITAPAPGTYTFAATNGSCTNTATTVVSVNPLPGAPVITPAAATICNDGSVAISASSAVTWSPPTYLFSNAIFTAAYTGASSSIVYCHPTGITATTVLTYVATSTNSFGCSSSASTTVTVNPSSTSISGLPVVCQGGTTTLASGTPGGIWTSSDAAIASVDIGGTINGLTAGTAIISYILGTCGYAAVVATVNIAPSSITGSLSVCVAASSSLTNAVSGGTWVSGTPAVAGIDASGSVTGVSPGTSIITYTIGSCYTTSIVTVNEVPSSITGITSLCEGGATLLHNTGVGGTWTSGDPSVAAIHLATGSVAAISPGTAIVTYSLGTCGSVITTLTVNPAPAIITGNHSICVAATVTLGNATPGGIWSSGSTAVAAISGSGVVSGVSAGTAVISYALGSCAANVVVTVNAPVPGIAGSLALCAGQTATLSNIITGGTWSSDNAAVATIGSVSGIVNGLTSGTAGVTYSLGSGCEATATVTVSLPPNAGTITGADNMCIGTSVTLSNAVPGGAWASGSTNATVSATGMVTGITAGTATISYTVTTGACSATALLVVTVTSLPDAGVIAGTSALCIGGVATLSETIAGGKWISGNTTVLTIDSATGSVSAKSIGTATVTYRVGAVGCINTAVFAMTVIPPAFSISGFVGDVQCYGGADGNIAVTISGGNPPYQYQWSNGGAAASIAGLAAGSYTLNVKETTSQCAKSDTFSIANPDSLQVTAVISNDLCKTGNGGVKTTVAGGNAPYKYLWSNNAVSSEINGVKAANYDLSVTDAKGCLKRISVTVGDTCEVVVVNDGISPNGDGINDTWVVAGITYYPANVVQVFDKWGDMVFEQVAYKNDWYGMSKSGSLLPDGNYYYVVKLNAPNLNGGENVFTGPILIKR